MRSLRVVTLSLLLGAGLAELLGATWQYAVPFDRGVDRKGVAQSPGQALCWLPPATKQFRGLLLMGRLGIELELALDEAIRQACAENDLAILYFDPHIDAVFHFWEAGDTSAVRLLKALDDVAEATNRPELRRVPWITAGHSTAGIFCRNLAYWKPERVAGILHLKSGNFHHRDHLPPSGTLAGVPLVAINGQFESFGPEGGIRPEFGRETQWVFVLKDLQQFRGRDPNFLLSLLVEPGADHFHGSPELCACAALFIRKTAQYRLPRELPPGEAPIDALPLRAQDGWLSDPDLYAPKHPPAPYADYAGEKDQALWHYDRETAEAAVRFHCNLGRHQVLEQPALAWQDDGDGWTFRAESKFLAVMPETLGGRVAGQHVGHAEGPIVHRVKTGEPVAQLAPDTFRLLRPPSDPRRFKVNIAAYHPGDDRFRSTIRWGELAVPKPKGAAQQIEFPELADSPASALPALEARASSGLPIRYEVDFGPLEVRDGRLILSDLPVQARFPIACRVTAHQPGRRTEPSVQAAPPVSRTFRITAPSAE